MTIDLEMVRFDDNQIVAVKCPRCGVVDAATYTMMESGGQTVCLCGYVIEYAKALKAGGVMIEEWRSCFEGLYEASSFGRVRRIAPYRVKRAVSPCGRILKATRRKDGYLKIKLYGPAGPKTRGVHQVVAEAFHGLRPEGCEVNHGNGNKMDNRPENLSWVTPSENHYHAFATGLKIPVRLMGEKNSQAKLTEASVRAIRSRHALGESYQSLSSAFGVCKSMVWFVISGTNWGHVR